MNFSIKDIFKKKIKSDTEPDKDRKIKIATCAILVEMAGIDGEFSEDEKDKIISWAKEKFSINDSAAKELIELSQNELKGSLDLWHFTNSINKNYSREEKINIIETVWTIIYADNKLDKYEDYLIHKLSKLLNISHKEMITAKLKVSKTGNPLEEI